MLIARPCLLSRWVRLFAVVVATFVAAPVLFAAASTGWPAPRVVPPLPSLIDPGAPPEPSAPPAESPHPDPVLLWPEGAPGSEARQNEPEHIAYRREPDVVFPIIFNVHRPSITPFLPRPEEATGAGVIIAPGGAFTFHTIDREGYDLARWLAERGVAAFVLKYRLPRDAANQATGAPQPYTLEGHAVADAQRAIRLVRSRAADWNVRPDRIGFLGFSAGGALALRAGTQFAGGDPEATDSVERESSRPDFFAPIYTGGFDRVPADGIHPEKIPPVFLLCAYDDRMPEEMARFLIALHQAGVNAELHIFSAGGHGWGVRTDRGFSVESWPNLFFGWLRDRGFLRKAAGTIEPSGAD